MSSRLTAWILSGMLLGAIAGSFAHQMLDAQLAHRLVENYLSIATDLFLRSIKMIIAPLVFFGFVSGIVAMGDPKAVGRTGVRALSWFFIASVASLLIGVVASDLLNLGAEVTGNLPAHDEGLGFTVAPFNLRRFITGIVPQSIAQAMAQNEVLQIVVFAIVFGLATASVGGATKRLVEDISEAVFGVCLRITGYVMWLAPVGVGAALCSVVTLRGFGILLSYGKLIGGFYGALLFLVVLLVLAGRLVIGPGVYRLIGLIREPLLIGFSTSSSEATFPKAIEQLERFGVPRRISGLVLPLGYSFNLDGSMLYQAFAVIFVAQAFHVDMSFAQQIGVLFVMLVTSKGMAGVPRASLVVVAASLPAFGLPASGLLLVLGVDPFFDMGRTAVSVLGNSIAAAAITKWEGALGAEISAPHASSQASVPETHGSVSGRPM